MVQHFNITPIKMTYLLRDKILNKLILIASKFKKTYK